MHVYIQLQLHAIFYPYKIIVRHFEQRVSVYTTILLLLYDASMEAGYMPSQSQLACVYMYMYAFIVVYYNKSTLLKSPSIGSCIMGSYTMKRADRVIAQRISCVVLDF